MIPAIINAENPKRKHLFFFLAVAAVTAINMLQDYLESAFNKTGFYFSESFLFSSFWWIFLPLLLLQQMAARQHLLKSLSSTVIIIVLPAIIHITAFPALVWLLSKMFYYHNFQYHQTLYYSMPEHLLITLIAYSSNYFFAVNISNKKGAGLSLAINNLDNKKTANQTSFLVSDKGKKILIPAEEVVFITAQSPYLFLHLHSKKYLVNDTLKAVLEKCGANQFIRIHKSVVVNIKEVQSYCSRQNGDYDLALSNGCMVRLSRNYAASFKEKFHRLPQN